MGVPVSLEGWKDVVTVTCVCVGGGGGQVGADGRAEDGGGAAPLTTTTPPVEGGFLAFVKGCQNVVTVTNSTTGSETQVCVGCMCVLGGGG